MNEPCEKMQEQIEDYVLGILGQKEIDALDEHISNCTACSQYVHALKNENRLLLQLGRKLDADMAIRQDRVIEALNSYSPTARTKVLSIWRTIMKSPITKLAAAAVIVVAALIVVSQIGGSGVALAGVLERVEQAHAFMYKMKMNVSGAMVPGKPPENQDIQSTVIISTIYGMKMEMIMTDLKTGEQMTQQMYFLPEEKAMFMVMPVQERYVRMEFNDDLLARMKKESNDPREMIKQILNCPYTELGRSVIDGVVVEGFEATDPALYGGAMGGSAKISLWVDVETWLPVLTEMDIEMGEQMRIRGVIYDYQWDIQVDEAEFEPVIPQNFKPLTTDSMKMPGMSEEGAVEGLKLFAELAGKYPEDLNMMTLMQQVSKLRDSQSPAAEQFRQKLEQAESDEERIAAIMDLTQPIQSIGMFYMTLVQDKKDPAYYGDKVTPEFPHAVLMRWKAEEGNYRVIFGDLTIVDVNADELAELEAAPLNNKPTAIRPQPADGTPVAVFADVELSWMPGAFVNEHKVYFGTAADQMLLLAEVTDSCSVMAPALERATTYYWCVDEVQPDGSVAAGDVWSFNTGKLIGFWKLDGDADDSSGNGNHGTVNGDPNQVIGQIGGALQFDGIDDYIRTDYATDLPAWTVAVWVNSPAAPKKAAPSGPVHRENNFQISWNHSSADFCGAAALRVGDKWYAASFSELEANQWYHLAATYDGENLKAYKNGVLITDNPDPSGAPDKESATLKFARHANYGDHFEGTIDDVRIYSYDLTADEVTAIYADRNEEK
ncbi:MAG TPA: LamG-like jellyroll fold domain-containing protein [Sedimentisphaerales bacterium]|nr:LamG-like jellyroll fold domain-containing protein [Sedimentisphaerales bacterium]